MKNSDRLIFVPTYNERDNVASMLEQLQKLNLGADILFLDDNSPDGTGNILDELAAKTPEMSVIHRPGKQGIGSAHQVGIGYAYDQGYKTLITLDCDFTHSPDDTHRLLAAAETATIAIGSRWMEKDSLPEWNLMRRSLTTFGHMLTRQFLRMPYDATGAFRVYHIDRIPRELWKLVEPIGYAFFFESLFILHFNGISIAEVPIVLPARMYGTSKMRWRDAAHSGFRVMRLGMRRLFRPNTFRPPKSA